jgi:tetratricopeptide (TPR) repeat protein
MNDNLTSDPLTDALPWQNYTVINGRDVLSDPGMAQLRRYLPVLAVIAAPYAGLGGDDDPLNPLDRSGEWRVLVRMLAAATELRKDSGVRLALVRLAPPTAARLGAALGVGGADAFPVVHIVCHGERDMLYLEDEDGHEAYAVAEHVVTLFKPGSARLVVLDGCFSRRIGELLVAETPVQAVVGTRRRVNPDNALAFNTRFYAELTGGVNVREAFRAAVRDLKDRPTGQADRYELVADDDLHEITLPLPEGIERAARPLLVESAARMAGIPSPAGFVGRRDMLDKLGQDIPASGQGVYVLHGPGGIGKSWLAAEFAGRFGWRFPDGGLWFPCREVSTTQEVIARLAQLLELPTYLPLDDVLDALITRQVLLVLDHVDAIASRAEQARLGRLVHAIAAAGSSVLITVRRLNERLLASGEGRTRTVDTFGPKDARTLAMRLAVERGVDALDVDTIDDFLEVTLSVPWLIARGVDLVEALGVERALEDLRAFRQDIPDPVTFYLRQRLEWIVLESTGPLRLLIRAQQLPDAFDERLAVGLGGEGTVEHVRTLLQHGLLRRDGSLYVIPAEVRALIGRRYPLDQQQRDRVDQVVMRYLTQTWPSGEVSAPLAHEVYARLNNARALLLRQIHPDMAVDRTIMARLLAAAAPAFRAAGLAEEFLAYAQGFREQLPEGDDLARLQVAMGDVASALPDQQTESGWLFRTTLRLDGIERSTWAEAVRAYGQHLRRVEQIEAADELLSDALKALLKDRPLDMKMAAALAHDWGNVLAVRGRLPEAVKRFDASLASYAQMQQAAPSAVAQLDLSRVLLRLGEVDRAEDVLRRALATADYVGKRDLAAQIRRQLAQVHVERANHGQPGEPPDAGRSELLSAEQHLSDAVTDLLPLRDPVALAAIYHELGQVQARLGHIDDGAANTARGRALFERFECLPDLAEASVTLGQLRMAQGDSVAAQDALYRAIDLAEQLDDPAVMTRAAGVLVYVHQIRARHARYADRQFRQDSLEQAQASRARLAGLGLEEHVAALDKVVQELAGAGSRT